MAYMVCSFLFSSINKVNKTKLGFATHVKSRDGLGFMTCLISNMLKGKANLFNLLIYDFVIILAQLNGLIIILHQFQRLVSHSIFINMY